MLEFRVASNPKWLSTMCQWAQYRVSAPIFEKYIHWRHDVRGLGEGHGAHSFGQHLDFSSSCVAEETFFSRALKAIHGVLELPWAYLGFSFRRRGALGF